MEKKDNNARNAYRRQLAMAWIHIHRPDVLAVIEAEVEKKYPLQKDKAVLPDSLKELK